MNSRVHIKHAKGIVILTAVFGFYVFGYFQRSASESSGPFSGLVGVFGILLLVPAALVFVYQRRLYKRIRNAQQVSFYNVAIAFPIIILIPLALAGLDIPFAYCFLIFVNLSISDFLFYYLMKKRPVLFGLAVGHLLVTLFVIIYWLERADGN